jgi:cell division protein FtsB
VLIFSFVVISKLYMDGHMEIQKLENELVKERARLRENLVTVRRLESEIASLTTTEGLEMVARDKLKFVRPEEVVIVPLKEGK